MEMETSLEELYGAIPPLPDEVMDSQAVSSSQLKGDGGTSDKEERKEEVSSTDAVAVLQPAAVSSGSNTSSDSAAVQPPCKQPSPAGEQMEMISDIDTSRASDGVQDVDSMRALGQQGKNREGQLAQAEEQVRLQCSMHSHLSVCLHACMLLWYVS